MKSMRINSTIPVMIMTVFSWITVASAQSREFFLQMSPGAAHCFKTPLKITQSGYPDLRFSARYKTESLQLPIYYSIKIGSTMQGKGWELEMIHLKLFLVNNQPEIQQFHISHGFNILQLNRIWELDWILLRAGGGMVIAHPENIIRGMKLNDPGLLQTGYFLAGPCFQLSAAKEIPLWRGLYLATEVKTTIALTRIKVFEGHALTPHASLHGLVGLGYRFRKKTN